MKRVGKLHLAERKKIVAENYRVTLSFW